MNRYIEHNRITEKCRGFTFTFLQPRRSISYGENYLIRKERFRTDRSALIEVWSVYKNNISLEIFKTKKAAEEYVKSKNEYGNQ
jgi:hypothetical protein